MAFWARAASWRRGRGDITEAARALTPAQVPERTGYLYGVPRGGINEVNQGLGASTQTDRRSSLQQLYESYLACPWAWACVNAIARTITAGGLDMEWDSDAGDGSQSAPDKPENVLACERLFRFTNDRQNIRQLMRNVVIDLLVFGDAFIEITWWGNTPVALYNLDVPTTTPETDEHGKVTGYKQTTEAGQTASFEPRDVIHISLDAPRSGVFGVSPTQAALLPITAWLFAAATLKEMFRKGLPPTVHADMPAGASKSDQEMWVAQVMARNVGPRNIGRPWVTRGGAKLTELQAGKVSDAIAALSQKRDEIVASYGVPPAKVSIIESGNLGGGTGEEQDTTYKVDVCAPIGELVLEAFNFSVVQNGLGVTGWEAKFGTVDYRASTVISGIQDQRIRNGSTTINTVRAENGEPPVPGGDDAVIIDRQNLVLVKDLAAMSTATVAGAAAKGAPPAPGAAPAPDADPLAAASVTDGSTGGPDGAQDGGEPGGQAAEAVSPVILARYRARLAEALRSMPIAESSWDGGQPVMRAVFAQLAKGFPPSAIGWVRTASWTGPYRVPVKDVDTSDRSQWDASHEPGEVDRFVAKLRRRRAEGRELKPAVIVKRPDGKLLIADGHHRFLAYEEAGSDYVWAYVGRVDADEGPWDQLALSQDPKGKAA